MNPQQQTFVSEMLRHGDKQQAYRTAYPGTQSDKTIESAVNRLLKHPEVKQAIDEPTNRIRAEAEAELKQRLQAELVDLYETQKTLSQIIRGQYTTERQVRIKGGFETIDVKPTVGQVLTALNTWFRLNGYIGQPATLKRASGEARTKTQQSTTSSDMDTGYWHQTETELVNKFPLQGAEGVPHPFGNIYPPEYPGPYYDPTDPNTKEKLQKLQTKNSTESSPPSEGGVARRAGVVATQHEHENTTNHNNQTESSPPSEGGVARRAGVVATQQVPENTTIHNNQTESSPPSEGGVARRAGVVATQHEPENTTPVPLIATTHNNLCPPGLRSNLTLCKNWKQLSPKTQQILLHDHLRKQGWLTPEDAANLVNDIHLRHQHRGTYKMLQQLQQARSARNLPPIQREPIEKETGWTFHPQYPYMMKRIRALEW
jgi:phage terminase small subunit